MLRLLQPKRSKLAGKSCFNIPATKMQCFRLKKSALYNLCQPVLHIATVEASQAINSFSLLWLFQLFFSSLDNIYHKITFIMISFDNFFITSSSSSSLDNFFINHLESFQTIRKVFRSSGKFPYHLESFQIIWKVSRSSGKFPDHPESFQIIWKVSRPSRTFPDHPESFQTIQKVSRTSLKFPDHP